MEFKLGLGLGLSHSLRLTLDQKLHIQTRLLSLRLELVEQIRDERYDLQGECPGCLRKLKPIEIIKGFNQNPNDFTTVCTNCGRRFEPTLICFGNESRIELPFYCDVQTLSQLNDKENFDPEKLKKDHAGLYRSAIIHFGSLKNAFAKIGIVYLFEDISDWKNKITPFLGRMPDVHISQCVNVPVNMIRTIRKKLGIPRYTRRQALEDEL